MRAAGRRGAGAPPPEARLRKVGHVFELALVGAGLALGGVVAWFIAQQALRTRVASLETLTGELRKQLSTRDLEVSDLRGTVDDTHGGCAGCGGLCLREGRALPGRNLAAAPVRFGHEQFAGAGVTLNDHAYRRLGRLLILVR